jgi:HEAT repeat protein
MGLRINIEDVNAMIARRNARGLIKVLLNSEDRSIRCLAASGYLIHTLEDKDVELRRVSAEELGKLKDFRAVEPLNKALEDKIYDVSKTARQALKNINEWVSST